MLVRTLITDPAGSAAHIWPAVVVANTGPGAASTGVQCAPPSRLTSSWLGQRVVEGTARQRSDVATPSRPEKNWTWFTAAGSRAITRQCRPASVVPISVRPQEVPEAGAGDQRPGVRRVGGAEGQRVPPPCHCGCQVRPAVTECQISARAAPLPGWPSSQPEAGPGNATAVYCGMAPGARVRLGWVGVRGGSRRQPGRSRPRPAGRTPRPPARGRIVKVAAWAASG